MLAPDAWHGGPRGLNRPHPRCVSRRKGSANAIDADPGFRNYALEAGDKLSIMDALDNALYADLEIREEIQARLTFQREDTNPHNAQLI